MGVVADFAAVSPEVWMSLLPAIKAAGIGIQEEGEEPGCWSYGCIRGAARVELFYSPADQGAEVAVYCSAHRFWRRPLSMWRLLRDVWRAILAAGASRTPSSGPVR
jgi:hypothetical protein